VKERRGETEIVQQREEEKYTTFNGGKSRKCSREEEKSTMFNKGHTAFLVSFQYFCLLEPS